VAVISNVVHFGKGRSLSVQARGGRGSVITRSTTGIGSKEDIEVVDEPPLAGILDSRKRR